MGGSSAEAKRLKKPKPETPFKLEDSPVHRRRLQSPTEEFCSEDTEDIALYISSDMMILKLFFSEAICLLYFHYHQYCFSKNSLACWTMLFHPIF